MTSRERLIAAARGGEVDQKPVIAWPGPDSQADEDASDAIICGDSSTVHNYVGGDKIVLAEVRNPFFIAKCAGVPINELLHTDPDAGSKELDAAIAQTRQAMQMSLDRGADGILYRLYGARSKHCSPMQYGGHYLERDRELLEEFKDANLNVLFVLGNEDVYLDFVSDLPAHVFAWDSKATGIGSEQVRAMRHGAQASADSASEITLLHDDRSIADRLDLLK